MIWHFMQIVSKRDDLHEMPSPVFFGFLRKKREKNIIKLSSAELAQRVIMVKKVVGRDKIMS